MSAVTWLGLVAACLTTSAFLPQVIKTWRTRSTQDISLGMFSVLVTGIGLWVVYGVLVDDIPVIAANGLSFLFAGTILYFKIRHG